MDNFFAKIPLVISYYTANTPYEQEVQGLIESCKKFSIACQIEAVPDRGSWEANCAFKPYFIREKMKQLQRPLLWVDADALFLRPLIFEEFMFSDFAILQYKEQQDPRFAVHAGTVYVNSTQGAQKGLDLWCEYADKIQKESGGFPPFLDQASLYFLFLAGKGSHVACLPLRYCKIFDQSSPGFCQEEVVIEQRQASRRLRSFCFQNLS